MSVPMSTKAAQKRELKVCRAAVKWSEFMEMRKDAFKWSPPERALYEAVTRLLKP